METWAIILNSVAVTSSFWFGFFLVYDAKLKNNERKKVEKLFKDKRW